ncbi:hypothetical protein A3E49_03640 [Candidatus Saccharibacteria bacterium RIFCSPHIGHO2_12_FULL_49_19]|nr:MAG: hypothetical protein A2708_02570 [Candidatus Saccharibacteria bacterium RIFCSPHIGHO2_01_FULL_49_21]OGL36235.1 MAG: hypothetical protein A3E49_03640 [Candidatus Saccharibacteria bacterium RIFCSPHIGHO2_12_FULL_49_19]OGL37335.1 MAG: hypothetical protein A3B63_02165 [Candidatus Saccharibacteria bacterium RIFCSPLOWO2_01_FULL_49_22]
MQKSYDLTLAEISVVAAVLLAVIITFSAVLFWRYRKRRGLGRMAQFAGLAVSDNVIQDQKLSSSFVLGAIQNGVVMVGKDNVLHLFNPAASKITGWPADEAIGLNVANVLQLLNEGGQQLPTEANPFTKALQTKQSVRDSNLWLATRSGKRVPISLIVSPILDPSSQTVSSVVGVFADTIKEREDEAKRSEFISTASHEMRTPIAAIEGYLALALNEKVAKIDPNARKYLQKASDATKQLGILFADLLTSSKAEDGRLANYPVVVEAGEIVEQVADAGRLKAKEKELGMRYIVSHDQQRASGQVMRPLYYIYIDPNRLREVLQNLIDNAIKYTSEGTITVRLTGDSTVVQIQIQDTGAGISSEDIPHLFQKFYRVDSSMTRTVGGTGLGLYICKQIIEMNNGRIWVESQLGKGSTFFINLPRLTAAKALEIQKRQASQISPLEPTHQL